MADGPQLTYVCITTEACGQFNQLNTEKDKYFKLNHVWVRGHLIS